MKSRFIKTLLAVLNSQFINRTPCRYGLIGNIDAFEYSHLVSEEKTRPGITVATILEEADRFRNCPIGRGLTVIEPDGYREADAFDLRDLRDLREACAPSEEEAR